MCVYVVGGSMTVAWDDRLATPLAAERHFHGMHFWKVWASGARFVEFPIYAAFLAITIPTLLVWRFCPKPLKPGHCRCGYNLTGLSEARCPECGTGFVSDLGA